LLKKRGPWPPDAEKKVIFKGGAMGILVVGGVLFGFILGQFFKFFVLIPACAIAFILLLTNPAHLESGLLGWFLQAAAVTVSLQIGYVAGLFGRSFHRRPKRSKELRGGGLPEVSSRLAERPEGGRRAA
jgi:hypothetical protein